MNIELFRADINDAEKIWKMQKKAFEKLFEKYRDYDTNPANEPLEKTILRLKLPETYYYYIKYDGKEVGAIRVVDSKNDFPKRISPIFIMPEYRNKGIAQRAITLAEDIHGNKNWELATILQEKGNCHLYEKIGYRSIGETKVINDKLTLIFYKK